MVFSGCFIWGPVKDGFQDFTAYFNTYYNGEHAFEDALKDVKTSLKEHDIDLISGQPSTLFTISPVARQGFDTAIEKASKVLQFYPTSGYTENCLFMIGIGYYYEGDNIRSGRKFIEEESKYPNSKRFSEAEMYYGEIEIRNRNYNDGYNDLMKSIATAEEERNWEIAAQTADDLSDYFLSQSDTTTAAVYLDSAAVFSKGDDASLYACESGSLFENIGNFEEAKLEYKAAWDYARDIRLRFYSRYFLARTERHEKQFYAALGDLRYLRKDDKFYQYFPLIDYQNAEALYDSGETSAAFLEFQRIDTAYATSEAATRSAFRVANIYLYKVGDYHLVKDSASYRFARAVRRRFERGDVTSRLAQPSESIQPLTERVVSLYEANVELAESLGREFGFRPLFFLQPTVFTKPAPVAVEREEAQRYASSEPMFRAVYGGIRGSARLKATPMFHDLSAIFTDAVGLIFIDYCHTTEAANARIADVMADSVIEALHQRDRAATQQP